MTDTVLFDLDNTLIQNQPIYEQSKENVAAAIQHFTDGVYEDRQEIVDDVIDAEDSDRYRASGVPKDRFGSSLGYSVWEGIKKAHSETGERAVDQDTVDLLAEYAAWEGKRPFFDYDKDDLLVGARDALAYVEDQGARAVIQTKGNELQHWKLFLTGLDAYDAQIVPEKNAEAFDAVLEGADPKTALKVGDSIKSDGIPALTYGIPFLLVSDEEIEDSAAWIGEHTDDALDEDDPWMHINSLAQDEFVPAYNAWQEYRQTGDIEIFKAIR